MYKRQDFSWATPEYKNYGYAELIDLYATGNYYTDITIEEYKKTNRNIWNETDSQAQAGTWYCCLLYTSSVVTLK